MKLARRSLLAAGAVAVVVPGRAADRSLVEAIASWARGQPVRSGRVEIEIAELVENGNAVPIVVRASNPQSAADAVREIVVFNERNPQRDVLAAQFGPLAARAEFATRIRLSTSQRLVALARFADGSLWQREVDVLVTLAACVEG